MQTNNEIKEPGELNLNNCGFLTSIKGSGLITTIKISDWEVPNPAPVVVTTIESEEE